MERSDNVGLLKPAIHLVVAIAAPVSGFNNFALGGFGGGCGGWNDPN